MADSIQLSQSFMVFITRFNLAFRNSQDWQGLNEQWLSSRVEILDRYLKPSLKMQTDQNFIWLVLVHVETPDYVFERIKSVPQARIFKTESDLDSCIDFKVLKFLYEIAASYQQSSMPTALITARLDSDDGAGPEYVERLKSIATSYQTNELPIFIDFPLGSFFNLRTDHGYIRRSKSRSCGVSKIEVFDVTATTIYCINHTEVSKKENCISVDTNNPMWLQTTHGFHINRTNKVFPEIRRRSGNGADTRKILKLFPRATEYRYSGNLVKSAKLRAYYLFERPKYLILKIIVHSSRYISSQIEKFIP